MTAFQSELNARLAALRERGLYREMRHIDSPQAPHIRLDGTTLLNFSSNDYLGLANEPSVKAAAIEAIHRYGAGAGASRLVCGSLSPHRELDETIADFKRMEAALSFSTGYAAALGTICSLMGKDDFIILDKLVHACIVDAARLSGATLRIFAHNDLDRLEHLLKWARTASQDSLGRVLVVTESVFSMDGDHAPLREIVELKDKYGAWLMVDEAHATGIYGANRRGLAEELCVSERIEIQMGTLGKAIGAAGGYICGSQPLVDFLVNRARSFIFSTAPVPAAAAAATAGIRLVRSAAGEKRRQRLWQRVSMFHIAHDPSPPRILPSATKPKSKRSAPVVEDPAAARGGCHKPDPDEQAALQASNRPSAIIPLLIGDETKAMQVAAGLRDLGLLIPAIRYPTVARGAARLRLTFTASHTPADIKKLLAGLDAAQLSARLKRKV